MSKISIFIGSVYGGAEQLAEVLKHEITKSGYLTQVYNSGCFDDVIDAEIILVITSTTGQGDIPPELELVYNELKRKAPQLSNKLFAVIAMGDSSYQDTFCNAGKKFAALLQGLHARIIIPTLLIDAMEDFDPEPIALPWLGQLLEQLKE